MTKQLGMILDDYTTVLMWTGIRFIDLEIRRDVLDKQEACAAGQNLCRFGQQLFNEPHVLLVHQSSPSSAAV